MNQAIYWRLRYRIEDAQDSAQVIAERALLSAVWPEHASDFEAGRRPRLPMVDLSIRIRAAMEAGRLSQDGTTADDIAEAVKRC